MSSSVLSTRDTGGSKTDKNMCSGNEQDELRMSTCVKKAREGLSKTKELCEKNI